MTKPHHDTTREKLRDGIDHARDKASHAYEAALSKANEAVDLSRDKARDAARQTAETIETNPMGVLVGGLALGALIAAVIPRGRREKELLAPVGRRVAASATAAIAAAKAAGKEELDGLGLTRSAAKDQARSLFDGVVKAATTAGAAATQAGKDAAKAK